MAEVIRGASVSGRVPPIPPTQSCYTSVRVPQSGPQTTPREAQKCATRTGDGSFPGGPEKECRTLIALPPHLYRSVERRLGTTSNNASPSPRTAQGIMPTTTVRRQGTASSKGRAKRECRHAKGRRRRASSLVLHKHRLEHRGALLGPDARVAGRAVALRAQLDGHRLARAIRQLRALEGLEELAHNQRSHDLELLGCKGLRQVCGLLAHVVRSPRLHSPLDEGEPAFASITQAPALDSLRAWL